MRAEEANHEASAANSAAQMEAQAALQAEPVETLGRRLCAARERLGWSRADVGARLKLPVQLIGRLEGDDYHGLTDGVFLRGYLRSYSRLVGLPLEEATDVAAAHSQAVPLVATGTISRSRYLFDRYSVSATYLILTAIIVVPAVWLATHGGLEQNLARTTPLDPPPASSAAATEQPGASDTAAQQLADAGAPQTQTAIEMPPAPAPAPVEQAPVTASMTPFTTTPLPPAAAEPPAAQAAVAGSGAHALELKLSQQSWVEILAADGRKLEYGMLAAGSEHSYRSDGPVSVRIGNAQGAVMHSDGQVIDLTPYQRGNVAHVRLFGAGGGATRIDQ